MRYVVPLTAAVLSNACLVQGGWGDCDHEKTIEEQTVSADGATSVRIIGEEGQLEVIGVADASAVRASGEACAAKESVLEGIEIRTSRDGDQIRVEAVVPDGRGSKALDLLVEVPDALAVSIDDGSGSMEVRSVGSVEIEDGSGSMEISDVRGDLTIDDGSGSITIDDVTGDVRVDDGSGSMKISNVGGSVTVDDGSGSIRVDDVSGDFTVVDDGSGGVNHSGVAGRVEIRD